MPSIPEHFYKLRACLECGTEFKPRNSIKKFCCVQCKGKHKYTTGKVTTEGQYLKISGDWRLYLQRLLYKKDRANLSLDDLLDLIHEQNYTCALTGEPLTCQMGLGQKHMTNASIDRIVPGSPYIKGNIRLVCRIANMMKWNNSDEDMYFWARKLLDYAA